MAEISRLPRRDPNPQSTKIAPVGADADLLIFKLENLQDMATYLDPYREASGWDWIIVGGKVVVEAGDPTGATPGTHVLNAAPGPD
jgi:N-acyl-D-aspartate/D-glutamate deacylase